MIDLPMEVWARVALHVPFEERLRTFRALRFAGCLPDTLTNASNAFMQFCSEADRLEREALEREDTAASDVRVSDAAVRVLVDMGFADSTARLALTVTHGAMDDALTYLLSA